MEFKPDKDAGWGLIFRLNYLWPKADESSAKGDYDQWNNVLDSIFRNLDYKVNYEVKTDSAGEIQEVILDDNDTKIYTFFCKKIFQSKNKFASMPRFDKRKNKIKSEWWYWLHQKDRWIRKFMQKRELYLKEVEHSPGTALFGSFGSKKRK